MRLFLVVSLFSSVQPYRIKDTENETLAMTPFERGFVGRIDAKMPEAANPGWNDVTSISNGRLRHCPSMVGPLEDNKYHCTSAFNGYCDRRSGTCFCNEGYSGEACEICTVTHQMIGDLCYQKTLCPNDCSNAGECNYLTGKCQCNELRDGDDCSQFLCAAKFDVNCIQCNTDVCLKCIDGYSNFGTHCKPCTSFDPRCNLCDTQTCLSCIDLLLYSIRRSGRRANDAILPMDEMERQLGKEIPFGNQDSDAFDDAEVYKLADEEVIPLDRAALSCDQGLNNDSSFTCRRVIISNKVCGNKGVISLSSPEYSVEENQGHVRISLKRSGGGVGVVSVMYTIEDLSTDGFVRDVSSTALYTTSQRITFNIHEIEKSFILPIHNDMLKVQCIH